MMTTAERPECREGSAPPAAPQAARPATPAPHDEFRPWIPMRSLSPRHREAILTHLLALPQEDRYLRFGFAASDAQIQGYVDRLDFERDEVYGVFNRRLQLIALAHVAFAPVRMETGGATTGTAVPRQLAEFGGSVLPHARGRGYGARLFEHAMLKARNRNVDTLFIHALSENAAMLHIARAAGARVARFGSESDAYLSLAPDTWASRLEQWLVGSMSWVDFSLKRHTLKVDSLLQGIGEVAGAVGRSGRVSEE